MRIALLVRMAFGFVSAAALPAVIGPLASGCSGSAPSNPNDRIPAVAAPSGGTSPGRGGQGGEPPTAEGSSDERAGSPSAAGAGGVALGSGGRVAAMGGAGISGAGGMIAGSGGGESGGDDVFSVAAALDGLRLDIPCGGVSPPSATCPYGNEPDDGQPRSAMTSASMGGPSSASYRVTLHIRGVTSQTHVMAGVAGDPSNFVTGGTRYPPTSSEEQFEQWRLTTSAPNQHYYLNAFNDMPLMRACVLIDMVETVTIHGGALVTLDVYDGNSHEIANTGTPPLMPTGTTGSMNGGQFIQLNVDKVAVAAPSPAGQAP